LKRILNNKAARRIWRKITTSRHLDPFPVARAVRGYNAQTAIADLRAGLNVALLAFPQGMAYAAIAGLPIAYGIYASAIAAFVGSIWGGSRFIILGPTNATCVLVFASFVSMGVMDMAQRVAILPMIVLLTGVFLIFGAFLKIANLIQYVSRSVVTGYITAAAIYIIVNQMRKVMGFDIEVPAGATFLDVIWLTVLKIPDSHIPTLVLSALTALVYIALNRRLPRLPNVAITLAIASVVNVALSHTIRLGYLTRPPKTLDAIDASTWSLTIPPLNLDLVAELAGVSLIIAFLAVLEGTSIGKSLAARSGERLDANQEMLGMGLANIGCALYQGIPASGSLTRSQLAWSSGARTQLSSTICGLLCAAGAFVLGPLTKYIPVSALGVLVVFIGLSLINRHVLRVVWNATGSDRTVFTTTFIAALLVRLDFAIILGSAVSILLFLRKAAQPELVEYNHGEGGEFRPLEGEKPSQPEISIVHVEGNLFFGAAELFRDQMRRLVEKPNLKVVVLKLRNAHHLDATSVLALEELARYMTDHDRILLISEARRDAIRIFRNSGLLDVIGRENIFPDNPTNPTLSTSKALKRAMKLLGGQSAEIRIFLGGSHKMPTA